METITTYNCNGLTGGAVRNLDSISISVLSNLDRAIAHDSEKILFFYFDSSGTEEENTSTHPYIIRPDDYSVSGVWKETLTDNDHTQNTDTGLGAVAEKNPPIDADKVIYRDSTDDDVLVTSTWTQVKAFLKTYFDTLYNKYVHPNHSGDVTSVADGAQTIANKAVTLAKMADMTTSSFIGRKTAGSGVPEILAKADALTILNVADGADVTGSNAPQAHKDSHDPEDGSDKLDTAAAAEISTVVAAGIGSSHSLSRADHVHAINHGITNNHIVTVDDADAAEDDYAKFTASGLEGRSYAEVRSDLGVIQSMVEDTTPELGGELDCGPHSIGFTQQSKAGDGTTTIDWKLGNKCFFTFGNANETFTFTAPSNPCNLLLVLKQYSTGGKTATWPATVKWPGGTAPTLSTGNNDIDIVTFYYDGTNYYGMSGLDFS